MFDHITILLSIVFALAMTHILASATELVWERDNVRFYGLHAVWMVNALLGLLDLLAHDLGPDRRQALDGA